MSKKSPSLAVQIYEDLGQVAFQHLGQYLGDAVKRRLNLNLSRAADKLNQENPENIALPKLGIAVPIMEKMRYTEEEVLADAFAELLKNSCLKDRQAKVLPAYSEILARLSSDEVKILDFVYREENTYKTPVQEVIGFASEKTKQMLANQNVSDDAIISYPIAGIPFLEVRSNLKDVYGGEVIVKYFTDIDKKVALSSPESIEVYIDNLQSLGMLDAQNFSFMPLAIYSELESDATRRYKENIDRENRVMGLVKGSIGLTPLAESFLAMCTSSKHNGESNASPA